MPISILLSALFLHASVSMECALRDATYTDSEEAGFTLRFEFSNPMVAVFTSGETGTDYRFELISGEGYDTTALRFPGDGDVSTAGQTIYAIDEDLDVRGDFPRPSDASPRYMFAPELGRLLWYQAAYMGGPGLFSGVRESLPRTLFKLTDCRGSAATGSIATARL